MLGANGNALGAEGQQPVPVSIDAKAFGAKYQSKREVYRFLTHDCGAYLASY